MYSPDDPPQHDNVQFVYGSLLPSPKQIAHPRVSVRRLFFMALTGLLGVALIFALIASLQSSSKGLVTHPSTLQTTSLDHIAVFTNLPWGVIAIDGKVATQLPGIHGENAIHLTHGKHTITLDAAPFLPQSCVISIPLLPGDTCQKSALIPGASQLIIPIYFSLSLKQLPREQQQPLLQAAQSAVNGLSSTETILPGEYYQAGATQATQLLHGTLHFTLDIGNSFSRGCAMAEEYCLVNRQNCQQFCSVTDSFVPLTQSNQTWNVFGVAQPQWDYATPDGHIIAVNQPDAYGGAAGHEGLLPLSIRWNGTTWQVSVSKFDPTLLSTTTTDVLVDIGCASAQNTLEVSPLANPALFGPTPPQWRFTSANQRAQGCLVTTIPGFEQPTPTLPYKAYLLYRFGTFVAVNAVAHNYWPDLPQADAHERAIAASLGAQV